MPPGYAAFPADGIAQAAQNRAMQPGNDLYWPDNPGITPSPGFGADPRFLGPPVHTSPHQPPGFLGPPTQQPPNFLGPPQQAPPGDEGGGFGFQLPHPPPPDLYAIGRHRMKQQQQNVMDPTRSAAIQEM